jgi:spore germination protein GerM
VTRARRAVLAVVLVVGAAASAVACGIPSDDHPRAIPEAAVPQQARGSGTSSTTLPPNGQTQSQTIYLVGGSTEQPRLVAVSVPVPAQTDPSLLAQATIQRLIETRPEDLGRSGETNQIPSSVRVLGATVGSDGVLELNLADALSQVESARLRLAMAQIVFTATDLKTSGINSVRVLINGQPASVPTQSGSAEAGQPVMRSDYPDLDPQLPQPSE